MAALSGVSSDARAPSPARIAIVTASYRGDFERCRLLCDSLDRFAEGFACHYLLVENRDAAMFRALEGPRRQVVAEGDLLPFWLRPITEPVKRRRLWLSPVGLPLRGWHVQQIRRIAFAAKASEDALLFCDSDVAFVRPFDLARLVDGEGRVRFHRVPPSEHRVMPEMKEAHAVWSRRAGRLLGIDAPTETHVGYIATAIAWRADTARDMAARIEAVTGRSALSALAATRELSECTIYGRFVDEVEGLPERHRPSAERLCSIYWSGPALDEAGLRRFVADMPVEAVAIGVQSFTGTDPSLMRRVAIEG